MRYAVVLHQSLQEWSLFVILFQKSAQIIAYGNVVLHSTIICVVVMHMHLQRLSAARDRKDPCTPHGQKKEFLDVSTSKLQLICSISLQYNVTNTGHILTHVELLIQPKIRAKNMQAWAKGSTHEMPQVSQRSKTPIARVGNCVVRGAL